MGNLFVYGTLCWDDLRGFVGGDDLPTPVQAVLPGYATHWAKGQRFPMIAPSGQGGAAGLLLRGCTDAQMARFDHYESGFGYALVAADVQTAAGSAEPALVYMPPSHIVPGPAWDLRQWMESDGALAREAAAEVMARLGIDPPQAVAAKYGMMQVRAAARLQAQAHPSPPSSSGLTADAVTVHDTRVPYCNFFALSEIDIQVPNFDGTQSQPVTRAGFVGTDAAIVLPYDPRTDRILLIEQFRVGPFVRSDPHPWLLEPVAGRTDAGEAPETTAVREAWEEARLTLHTLHKVHSGYASPGCSTEYFHVYVGEADITDDAGVLGGLATEHEDIQGHVMTYQDFFDALQGGQLPVTPLALAGYWLAANRSRLRAKA